MGKLLRGALWVAFPPAGAVATVNAGAKKRHQELLEAVNRLDATGSGSAMTLSEMRRISADGKPMRQAVRSAFKARGSKCKPGTDPTLWMAACERAKQFHAAGADWEEAATFAVDELLEPAA
jgi:hypothetical protein